MNTLKNDTAHNGNGTNETVQYFNGSVKDTVMLNVVMNSNV